MRTPRFLSLLSLLSAVSLPAQQVALAPDSLTLAVGDTARVVATARGAGGLRLSYRGTNATAFTVHRDGRVTARAVGCGYMRVGVVDSTWSRGQVRVCVETAPAPAPTPDPHPVPAPPPAPAPSPDLPAADSTAPQFHSDWRKATGSSVAAMTDGGTWPVWAWGGTCTTNPAACQVKIIDEPDFPSGRAFYSGYHGNASSTGVLASGSGSLRVYAAENRWPVPSIGQTIFHRFYLKHTVNAPRFGRNLGGASHHPVEGWDNDPELGGNCAFHWEYRYDARADGTFTWNIANLRGQGDWFKRGLLIGRAYLMEVAYTRTGPTSWRVRARLDGVDQGQIFPGDAQIGSFCLRSLYVGNNDPGAFGGESRWRNSDGTPVAGGPYADLDAMRWGAFAVAVRADANAWIGAYDPRRGW